MEFYKDFWPIGARGPESEDLSLWIQDSFAAVSRPFSGRSLHVSLHKKTIVSLQSVSAKKIEELEHAGLEIHIP